MVRRTQGSPWSGEPRGHHRQEDQRGVGTPGTWGWGHHAQETPCDLGTSWGGEPRGHHGQENPTIMESPPPGGPERFGDSRDVGHGVTTVWRTQVTLGHHGEKNPTIVGSPWPGEPKSPRATTARRT